MDILHEHIAPSAFHNSAERYDPPKCHPNTRVAVIQAIIDWIEDGQKTTFIKWLYGPAGTGKSAIAQEIAELCFKSRRLAATFFWSRGAAGRNDEKRFIASLAYQLLLAIPQMRSHVEEAVETDHSIFARSLQAQMESLIVGPLEKVFGNGQQVPVNSTNPKLIILDGLDECGTPEAQKYILRVIAHSVRKFPIPLFFLIASRPEQAIRASFNNAPLLSITHRLILDETYHPDDDIRLFLVESFASVKSTHELRSLLPRVWPTKHDVDHLVLKSSGQFIYAATVVKFVGSSRRMPSEQLDIILGITAAGKDTPFAELDALYRHIFSLVEDFPKALEVLSFLFLTRGLSPYVDTIERVLSYSPGKVQLILADLHSVINVPDVGTKYGKLHVIHASLQDFLMDPTRSKNLWIDIGNVHACIAQHYLRYIDNYQDASDDEGSEDEDLPKDIFDGLEHYCSHSSPTRELLADLFDFDLQKWVAKFLDFCLYDLESSIITFSRILRLYGWIQAQVRLLNPAHLPAPMTVKEANVKHYFGTERSLSSHHSRPWEVSLDLVCAVVCDKLSATRPLHDKNVATAMTHPQIFHHCNNAYYAFEDVIGDESIKDVDACMGEADADIDFVELQKYLRDPERAGTYFVHSGMYATLSARIFKFILKEVKWLEDMQAEYDERISDDEDIRVEIQRRNSLVFSIQTLPFYLSNADYTPELARHASDLLSVKYRIREGELHRRIKLLHETIDLYLKKRSPALNAPQGQFQRTTAESRPSNLSEESVNMFTDFSDYNRCFGGEKRRRNSEASLEGANLALPMASPSIPPSFKRLRTIDPHNPDIDEEHLISAPSASKIPLVDVTAVTVDYQATQVASSSKIRLDDMKYREVAGMFGVSEVGASSTVFSSSLAGASPAPTTLSQLYLRAPTFSMETTLSEPSNAGWFLPSSAQMSYSAVDPSSFNFLSNADS